MMYLLCSEFIEFPRKFCHSPAFVNTIPTLVRQLFTDKVQVMTEEELEVFFMLLVGQFTHFQKHLNVDQRKQVLR